MERSTMKEALRDSISKVLETMFFQPVQITINNVTLREWFTRKPLLQGASINFTGPVAGSLFFLIPESAANEITANFLGINAERIDAAQRADTVKEALNMIGGNMLSVVDTEGLFTLDIPQLIAKEALSSNKLQDIQGEILCIRTEDSRMVVGFRVENLD